MSDSSIELSSNHFSFQSHGDHDFRVEFRPLGEVLYFGATDYDDRDVAQTPGPKVLEELIVGLTKLLNEVNNDSR